MEDGAMPKEMIAVSIDESRLEVSWTKHDDLDPTIGIGSWKPNFLPDGTYGGWEPVGPQWALDYEAAGRMADILQRARRQVYRPGGAESEGKVTIHVHGSLLNSADVAAAVHQELRKLERRSSILGLGGVGSDHD